VRKSVLVVAQQIQLRARIARVLHSAGYGAEFAGNQKRALELAARKDIHAAIVVHSTDLAGLGQKLRGKIPTTILVGHRTGEIARPGHAFQGTDAFPEDDLDEQELLDRLSQPAASPGSKRDETVPAPVKIEDCELDIASYTFTDGSGREVRLTRAETALLTAFVASPRRVLSRDQLRYAVARRGAEPYDRSVDMLIARLRRKIEPDPKAPRFILSVQGVGYKFDIRPQSAANELRTLNTPMAIGYSVAPGQSSKEGLKVEGASLLLFDSVAKASKPGIGLPVDLGNGGALTCCRCSLSRKRW
jgi:DNA-binding response OmpR family regulator